MAQATQNTSTADSKKSKKNFSPQQPYRILALDGGGIYGLCTAIMLRKLAERDDDFLKPENINMFAGTSAGALNSLFLAKQANPREFVLSGGLEAFWDDARIFTNDLNPVAGYLSLFGVTAFLGSEDYMSFLRTHFDDMTLADLKHTVVIDVFDWSGISTHGDGRHWRAEIFTNFDNDDNHKKRKVVDVGYAAGSPPGLRAIRDGFGDGGMFAPNPSLNGLSRAVKYLNRLAEEEAKRLAEEEAKRLAEEEAKRLAGEKADDKNKKTNENKSTSKDKDYDFLDCIKLLSLGICTRKPYYWLDAFDLGNDPFFNQIPTNPLLCNWYPPTQQVVMQAPSTDVIMQCDQLIGDAFHRLNPELVGPPESPPALAATALCRFPHVRLPLLQYIRNTLNGVNNHRAFKDTVDFLKSPDWQGIPATS